MTAKVDIFNGASIAIGAGPVFDVDEDTTQAIALRARYDAVYETALTSHRWGFARVKAALSKLTASPRNEWGSAFQIPAEALAVFKVYPQSDYQIYGDEIYSNATSLDVDMVARVSEGSLPGYFVNALVLELSSQIAIPVTRNPTIASNQKTEALLAWRQARGTDSMQRPTEPVTDLPFIWVRSA